MTGDWPSEQVDHVNHNTADNRWANLRPATRSENNINRKYIEPATKNNMIGL
jgi:hypothetical protein